MPGIPDDPYKYVRSFTPGREAIGTIDVAPGSARSATPATIPSTPDGLFDLEVSYPTIEPPGYLMALHPDVYQAEQAFATEHPEAGWGWRCRMTNEMELVVDAGGDVRCIYDEALGAERAWLAIHPRTTAVPLTDTISMPLFCPSTS